MSQLNFPQPNVENIGFTGAKIIVPKKETWPENTQNIQLEIYDVSWNQIRNNLQQDNIIIINDLQVNKTYQLRFAKNELKGPSAYFTTFDGVVGDNTEIELETDGSDITIGPVSFDDPHSTSVVVFYREVLPNLTDLKLNYRKYNQNDDWIEIDEVVFQNQAVTIDTLEADTEYEFVFCSNDIGNKKYGPIARLKTDKIDDSREQVPAAPVLGLLECPLGQTTINFTAPELIGNTTQAQFQKKVTGGAWVSFGAPVFPPFNEPFEISGLLSNTFYSFRVIQTNPNFPNLNYVSSVSSVKTLPLAPDKPDLVTFGTMTSNSVEVILPVFPLRTDYFVLERGTGENKDNIMWQKRWEKLYANEHFPDVNLEENKQYWYRLIAINQCGENTGNSFTVIPHEEEEEKPESPGLIKVTELLGTIVKIKREFETPVRATVVNLEKSLNRETWEIVSAVENDEEVTLDGLTVSTVYWFRFSACNEYGCTNGERVGLTTDFDNDTSFFDSPEALTVSNISFNKIDVNFPELPENADSFSIEIALAENGVWETQPVTPNTFAGNDLVSLVGLLPETDYWIRGIAHSGSRKRSTPVLAKTTYKTIPLKPDPLVLTFEGIGDNFLLFDLPDTYPVNTDKVFVEYKEKILGQETQIVINEITGEASLVNIDLWTNPWIRLETDIFSLIQWEHEGLEYDNTYKYRLIANNESGDSEPSDETEGITWQQSPEKPNSVEFKSPGGTYHSILYSGPLPDRSSSLWLARKVFDNDGNSSDWEYVRSLEDIDDNRLTFYPDEEIKITGLTLNTRYEYAFVSNNNNPNITVENNYGPTAQIITNLTDDLTYLTKPETPTLDSKTDGSVKVKIEQTPYGIDYLNLQISSDGTNYLNYILPDNNIVVGQLVNVVSNGTVMILPNTKYWFRVRVVIVKENDGILSSISDSLEVTTKRLAPEKPVFTEHLAISQTEIKLVWTKGARTDALFLERKTTGTWERIKENGEDKDFLDIIEYTDSELTLDTTYSYQLVAINESGPTQSVEVQNNTWKEKPDKPDRVTFGEVYATHFKVFYQGNRPLRCDTLTLYLIDGDTKTPVRILENGNSEVFLKDMEKETRYVFQFGAANTGGEVFGDIAAVITDSDEVSLAPNKPEKPTWDGTSVDVFNISHQVVGQNIKIKSPEWEESTTNPVMGMELYFLSIDLNDNLGEFEESEDEITIALPRASISNLAVRAYNLDGLGNKQYSDYSEPLIVNLVSTKASIAFTSPTEPIVKYKTKVTFTVTDLGGHSGEELFIRGLSIGL